MRFSKKNCEFLPFFILAVFPFVAYWQIGTMQYVMKWDMLDQFFPYRYFLSECYQAGQLPLWNPYQHLGWPFHADPQSGFWYPVAWLFTFLRGYDVYTMNFEFLFHIAMAGMGFFLLLRGLGVERNIALLFSIAYQGSGVFISNSQHLTWIVALTWLPYVIHFYFKMLKSNSIKNVFLAAVFMMFLLTGGYPIFTLILNYFLLSVFAIHFTRYLIQREWKQMKYLIYKNAGLYACFVLISCGYLVSFLNVMPEISRGNGLSLKDALYGSFTPQSLASLLLPFAVIKEAAFFGDDISMLNVYFGLIPFAFSIIAFKYWQHFEVKLFLAFGIFCLITSMGKLLPVRSFLYHYIPFMDSFRFPSIFRGFFIISFLIAGALAMQHYFEESKSKKQYHIPMALWLISLPIIGLLIYAFFKSGNPINFPAIFHLNTFMAFYEKSNIYDHIKIQAVIQLALLLVTILIFKIISERRKLIGGLAAIICIDIFISAQFNIPVTSISEVNASLFQKNLNDMPKGFPIPELIPVKDVPTYDKHLFPSWHNHNIFTKQPTDIGFNSFVLKDFVEFLDSPLEDGVLNHSIVYFSPMKNELDSTMNLDESQNLAVKEFSPGKVNVSLYTPSAGQITLLQNNYKGWEVFLDNQPISHFTSDMAFISADIPSGQHDILFQYQPDYFIWATLVTIGSMTAIGIFLIGSFFLKSIEHLMQHGMRFYFTKSTEMKFIEFQDFLQ